MRHVHKVAFPVLATIDASNQKFSRISPSLETPPKHQQSSMAITKRQKQSRDSKAAYAASQPLFVALQHGAAQASTQTAYLSKARDTVQKVHVELVNTTNIDDAENHVLYMDCAVKAWRNATEVFSNVFTELCNITAADPTKGREASKEYDGFKAMAETAAAAQKAAMSYDIAGERIDAPQSTASTPANASKRVRVEDEEDEEDGATTTGEESTPLKDDEPQAPTSKNQQTPNTKAKRSAPADDVTPPSGQPSAKKPKPSDDTHYDKEGHRVLFEKGAREPNVPFAELAGADKKAWLAEKARQLREKRNQKKKAKKAAASHMKSGATASDVTTFGQDYVPLGADEPQTVAAGKENKVPGVEYEDVSAEVAARLKAKEEKKRAKKEEKKRKRESGDSALLGAVVAEKPSRKKVRTVDGAARADIALPEKLVKRKQDGATAVEDGDGRQAAKKRKV